MTTTHPNIQSSRRRFIMTGLGTCLAMPFALPRLQAGAPQWITDTRTALGSKVSIRATHEDPTVAKQGIREAFQAIENVESIMSLYRSESQISLLNRQGKLDQPAPDLVHVLRMAQALARKSRGAFDVTIQPLWSLFRSRSETGTLPTPSEIENVTRHIDWRQVKIEDDRITLMSPDTQITLNGIAQGFATDQARQALVDAGIRHALVDCGELGALGQNAKKQPWKVGIQHPREPDAFATLTQLDTRSLATSGDYETRFSANYRHHHIFDPRTGHSPSELASASVAAPTALLADALSTTLMVTGVKTGLDLIQQFRNVDALLITKDERTFATSNFPLQV